MHWPCSTEVAVVNGYPVGVMVDIPNHAPAVLVVEDSENYMCDGITPTGDTCLSRRLRRDAVKENIILVRANDWNAASSCGDNATQAQQALLSQCLLNQKML